MLLISRSWWVSSNVAFPRNFVTRFMWQKCVFSFIYMKQDIVWFHQQWVSIYRWFRIDSVYPSAGSMSWCTVNPILTLLPQPSVASPIFLFRRLQAYISQHDWDKLMDQRCFFSICLLFDTWGIPFDTRCRGQTRSRTIGHLVLHYGGSGPTLMNFRASLIQTVNYVDDSPVFSYFPALLAAALSLALIAVSFVVVPIIYRYAYAFFFFFKWYIKRPSCSDQTSIQTWLLKTIVPFTGSAPHQNLWGPFAAKPPGTPWIM